MSWGLEKRSKFPGKEEKRKSFKEKRKRDLGGGVSVGISLGRRLASWLLHGFCRIFLGVV